MNEFDHVSAWYECACPEYEKLPQAAKDAYLLVHEKYTGLHQRSDLGIDTPPDVATILSKMSDEELIRCAVWVDRYGNWMPLGYGSSDDMRAMYAAHKKQHIVCENSGAHWKIEKMAMDAAENRMGTHAAYRDKKKLEDSTCKEYVYSRKRADWLLEKRVAEFHGKPVPPYPPVDVKDNDEVFEALKDAWPAGPFSPVTVTNVNHRIKAGVRVVKGEHLRRGMFMITSKHLELSDGVINPRAAPCGRTGNAYDDFESDRVLVLAIPENSTATNDERTAQIKLLGTQLETLKLDGVVLTKT